MSGITIGKAIHKLLRDAGVKRVFPNIAENETPSPFVIYRIISYRPSRAKDYIYTEEANVRLTIVADTYNESLSQAEIVRCIETSHGDIAGHDIESIELNNMTTSYQGTAHVVELDYTLTINT